VEGEALLERILENTPALEPLYVQPELSHEEVSFSNAELEPPIQRPSPEPETPKEGFQPSESPSFEDKFHEDFRNISKYSCQKRPPVPVTPREPLDKEFLRKSIKELTTIMSREWIEEVELPSEEIQIHSPSLTIQCKIRDNLVDVLYNPTVGANIMSTTFVSAYFGKEPLAPINKSLRFGPCSSLKGRGILQNTTIRHHDVIMVPDFHMFDVQDFDIDVPS
jgi:hypothetical protein